MNSTQASPVREMLPVWRFDRKINCQVWFERFKLISVENPELVLFDTKVPDVCGYKLYGNSELFHLQPSKKAKFAEFAVLNKSFNKELLIKRQLPEKDYKKEDLISNFFDLRTSGVILLQKFNLNKEEKENLGKDKCKLLSIAEETFDNISGNYKNTNQIFAFSTNKSISAWLNYLQSNPCYFGDTEPNSYLRFFRGKPVHEKL